jgi:glycosyltransferase involved in cell wall biosynthesis
MKILFVSRYPEQPDQPRGGVESVTVMLAEALAALDGNEVHVVTLERNAREPRSMNIGLVRVHRLPRSSWPMLLDIHAGPGRRRLARVIADLSPDVVHFHETWGLGCVPTRCPQLFTVHGFDSANLPADNANFSGMRSKLWKWAEARGFAKTRHLVSISPYVTRQLRPHTTSVIEEIENPVDSRFFEVIRREEAGRVLCVGWVSPRKNTLGSLRAFHHAFQAGSARQLIVGGTASDPEYFAKVNAEIAQRGLEQHVQLVGQLNHHQLRDELQHASVMLLPSLQENAPMAISEAMAAGVPVITSNRCGMPYMVEEGRSGFLVDPLDERHIAERLQQILDDDALRTAMSVRAREIARERFHPSEVARKTLRAYQTVIGHRYEARKGLAKQLVSTEAPR